MMRFSLTFALLAVLFACSYSYVIPSLFTAAYDDRLYVLLIPYEEGITEVVYFTSHNKPLSSIVDASFRSAVTSRNWSHRFKYTSKPIKIGDYISYIVRVTKDGVNYTSEPRTFTVTEILPRSYREGYRST